MNRLVSQSITAGAGAGRTASPANPAGSRRRSRTASIGQRAGERSPAAGEIFAWTGAREPRVLFDSDVLGMEHAAFTAAVVGRRNILFLIETDKTAFGGFVPGEVKECDRYVKCADFFIFRIDGPDAQPRRWFRASNDRYRDLSVWVSSPGKANWFWLGHRSSISFGGTSPDENMCFHLHEFFAGVTAADPFPRSFTPRRLLVASM